MALGPDPRYMNRSEAEAAHVDVGLRQYMLRVYNYMAGGVALTGAVAYFVAQSPALMQTLMTGGMKWIVMLAPLAFMLVLSFGIHKMRASTAQLVFWAFAAVFGLSLSTIFVVFTGTSIARVFFITAGMFAAMSLYGYTTKRDLSGLGSFLFMGLIGIIIASVVNIFLASSALHFVISVVGVLVFTGLTAYDTQRIKDIYSAADSGEVQSKKAIMGATALYLDFVNLFMMLLHLLGNRE